MPHDELKQMVCQANRDLVTLGLVALTWGNVSGADRAAGVMAIKPSGVPYEKLQPADIVVLSLAEGRIIEGTARPSSDAPTHLYLYQNCPDIGGIVHTHSIHATSFAQAKREMTCLGTTHADTFYGAVPVTRDLRPEEIHTDYELNTGRVIIEYFKEHGLNPAQIPGVLVAGHAPFVWGPTATMALENALVLELVAKMQLATLTLAPAAPPIAPELLDKHFRRKHGPGAYYGQKP
jgi:L-ribulose-5-phosphate 4-epimerase